MSSYESPLESASRIFDWIADRVRGRRKQRCRPTGPALKVDGTGCVQQVYARVDGSRKVEEEARQRAFRQEPSMHIPRHVRYNVGFNSALKKTQPVHETLTLAALALADSARWGNMTYDGADAETWELFRGVMFNDDPCCDLFEDDPESNSRFSSGVDFGARFSLAKAEAELASKLDWPLFDLRKGSLTGRSHFYDLQFLHGMAMEAGEEARTTRSKILLWCQIMYRLAVGDGVTAHMPIRDVPVELDGFDLRGFFDESTSVKPDCTLSQLLTNGSVYKHVDVKRRALGSCLHVIQDSYARGHTRRERGDCGGILTENAGDILDFHCYLGQDSKQHAHFDDLDVSGVSPGRLGDFDGIPGARAAIIACSQMIRYWQAGRPWTGAPETFLREDVFKCSRAVMPSDTSV